MIEIIIIIVLARKLAEVADSKGRSKGWAALGPGLWILGEIIGAVVGLIISGDQGAGMYVFALVGAAVGAGVAWAIVNNLSATQDAYMMDNSMPYGGGYGHADPNNPYSPPGYGQGQPGQQPPNQNNPWT